MTDTSLAGDFGRRLEDLSERMRRLGVNERAPAAPMRSARAEGVDETALDEIAATVGRLSGSARARTPSPPRRDDETSRILETLEALDRRVRSLTEEKAPRRPARSAAETPSPARARSKAGPSDDRRPTRAETERARLIDVPAPRAADALERQFRELGDKIEQLGGRSDRLDSNALIEEIRALRGFIESRAGGGADVSDQIRRLAGKIDRLAELQPERDVIEPLMTEIGRLRDVVLQTNFEGSLKTIEAGYGHIVDRLDDLKRGLAGPRPEGRIDAEISEIRNLLRSVPQVGHLSSLERNLSTLSDKFERLAARDETPAAQQIERRLLDLRSQIETFDPAAVTRSLDLRLKAVTDKLDALERATHGPVASDRVITLLEELRTLAGGNRAADEIRALDARIAELGERIAEFETRRPSFDDTDRLHERIAEIAGKLDSIANTDDGRRAAEALDSAVARLDAAIARSSGPQASDRLDARFDQLLDQLDRRMPPDPTAEVESLTREIAAMRRDLATSRGNEDLEEQMRLLAERIDRSISQEGDDDALAQIEEQLVRISGQIEATQDRVQDIGALEGHILKLAERMEDQHLDSVTAAREAAREMVREMAESRTDDGAAETALRALQDDLRSLQSAARDTETRTNDTLISLHDALTGIVGRLAAIEKIAQGSARSAAAARNAAQAAETAAQAAVQPILQPAPQLKAQPFAARPVESDVAPVRVPETAPTTPMDAQPTIAGRPVATNPITRARELLANSSAPEDNRPLEPGSGKPTARMMPPPKSMPMPGADPTAPAARKADFIAAARRAAQAAANTTASAPEAAPPIAPPGDRTVPVAEVRPGETEGNDAGALSRIGRVLKNRRRPLVLATAAVVLAILTLQMLPNGKTPATKTADTKLEQTTAPEGAASNRSTVAEHPTTAAESILTKTPNGEPSQGFSMPLATDGSTGSTPAASATEAAETKAPQRTSSLGVPLAGEDGAPTVTGSIPGSAATRAATPIAAATNEGTALPEKIGPEALRTAAVGGDAKAAFEVGLRYAEGRTVPADLAKAADWYARAADQGLATAQYRLAVAYEKGLGVARDSEKSKTLYKAAAEQGNVRAMHNLGVIFANARDMTSAVPWFQKAADLGLRDSQFNLGIIHALGSGVKQDLAVSYKWFALAARQGDTEAEKKQTEIAGHLDKVNLAAARMAVQTWVQRPLIQAANDEVRGWGEPATAGAQPSADEIVRQAQSLLKAKGFYTGSIDGAAGPSTSAAIRTFQKKAGLPQTGEIDPSLMKALTGRSL